MNVTSGHQPFGKYQILERIATGGMAEIYKARLEGIGGFQRTFAIKRILPNLSQNSEYIAMLVDEAKVAGLLSHANIVQILDLGQVDNIWYIAMEYVAGRDLGAVLRRAKKKGLCLPVPHTVFVTIELLKGLEYAHQRQVMRGGRPVALNIIHRDVSPPNVLLSFQGEVKLTDFGIARASLKAMETVSGIVKGRFDYMSPEQAAGSKDLDQRSDLFSVGVVLYEMLTGHHPFRTDNEIGTIEKVRSGRYTPVSQRNPEVPFTLEQIVDRALQVNRDDRYPSATAFKEALDKFFHDAGFIFTHATLASYVKGLFPEATQKPNARSASPAPPSGNTGKVPRPGGTPIPADTTEGPTRRVDRRRLRGDDPSSPGSEVSSGLSSRTAPGTSPNPLLSAGGATGASAAPAGNVPSGNAPITGRVRDERTPITNPPTGPTSGSFGRGEASQPTATQPNAGPPAAGPGGRSAQGVPTPTPPPLGRAGPSRPPEPSPLPLDAGRLPDFAGGDEQETLIRKVPAGFEEELATQLRSAAQAQKLASDFGAPPVEPDPATVLRSQELRAAELRPEPLPEDRAPARRRGSGTSGGATAVGIGLVPYAFAVFAGLAGLFGGAIAASIVWMLVPSRPGGAGAVPAAPPPQLEVVAPPGSQILLDKEAVGRSTTVSPGVMHTLEVTLPGKERWETQLRLQPGESRVVMVTSAEAKPPGGR